MRDEKQLLLDEVKEKIEESKGFVVAGYKEFTAPRAREFRNTITELGGEFEVVAKRVFVKAAEACGVTFDPASLGGHIGVVFAHDDALKIAKGTVKYGEDNGATLTVLAGFIDGEVCTAQEVEAIAKLPSQDELRAQLVGLFEAPMSQTVAVLQAALTGILYCFEEKSNKGE